MNDELPDGWMVTCLESIVESDAPIIYGILQPGPDVSGGVPYVRPTEIANGAVDLANLRRTTPEIASRYKRSSLKSGDVLLSIVGTIGKVAITPKCLEGGNITQSSCRLRFDQSVISNMLGRYFLLSPMATNQFDDFRLGTAVPRLNLEDVRRIEMPLPPRTEQHRIVAKIDSLFARSSRARNELAHIPKLIERYRQAVLEAAFRGDLTADWRQSHPHENPTQHLAKVLSDRRSGWLAAQASSRRRNYPEPEEADWFPDVELPDGWTWASVDQLTTEMQYGTSAKTNEDANGVPVLRMGNIVRGELQVDKLKYLPTDHDEFPALLLQSGDIVFNRTNSPELVGKTAVFRNQLPKASFASYLIRLKAVGIIPELLSAYINSPYGRSWVGSVVSQQVGQANVNGTKLSRLAVPLIPNDEQVILAHRIAEMMVAIDSMEREMLRAASLIDRLDQSILDKAFTGKLVPQDPADEPASKLLERIKAARDAAPKAKRGRKQR